MDSFDEAALEVAIQLTLPSESVPHIASILRDKIKIDEELLTIDEAALVLKCDRNVISKLCAKNDIPSLNPRTGVRNNFRIRKSDLFKSLEHHRAVLPGPGPRMKKQPDFRRLV